MHITYITKDSQEQVVYKNFKELSFEGRLTILANHECRKINSERLTYLTHYASFCYKNISIINVHNLQATALCSIPVYVIIQP